MRKKVLIAEDDYAISLAIKTIVSSSCDCELTIVKDGEAAWQAAQTHMPDLIISDWNMPLMTGEELLKNIRSDEQLGDTPFLMLSARSDKDSVLDAIDAGVTDYMHKPFDRKTLIMKVTGLLGVQAQDPMVELFDLPEDENLQES
ncbi:MAG TPA: response regulator [Gammaproteobacteria bacterium]|nr:response regulator [Gammaproteobacteria bacterium]